MIEEKASDLLNKVRQTFVERSTLLEKVRQNLVEHWHWENSQEQPDLPFCSHSRLAEILEMTVSELREFENEVIDD